MSCSFYKSLLDLGYVARAIAPPAMLSLLSGTALAQTAWQDPGTGSWFNSDNWSAGVPSSDENATVDNGGTAQLTTGGTGVANLLTIGSTSAVQVLKGSTLEISGGSGSGVILLNDGTLQSGTAAGSGETVANTIQIGPGGGTVDSNGNRFFELSGTIAAVSGGGLLTLTSSVADVTDSNGNRTPDIILSGTNSYTGGTQVTGVSNVVLDATNALGVGSLYVAPDAWVILGGSYNQTVTTLTGSGQIFASGFRSPNGSGAAILTVQSGNFSGLLSDGHGLDNGGQSTTGTLALIKTTTGTLRLTGQGFYSGGTQFQAGTIEIGHDNALGSGTLAMSPGTTLRLVNTLEPDSNGVGLDNPVTLSGTDTIDTQDISSGFGLNGPISGTGTLVKIGSSGLALRGSNTYSGGTIIKDGRITVFTQGALGSGLLTLAGGTLKAGADGLNIKNPATLAVDSKMDPGTFTFTYSGDISGTGSLTKANSGTLVLTGNNSYSGGTQVATGKLSIGSNTALGTGPVSLAQGTTLAFAENGLNLANPIRFTQAGDPTIDTGANNDTISGVISGPGSLEKLGTGTLDLTGASTYTGTTTIEQGTILVDGSIVSTATINSGAALGGSGSIGGFHVLSGATLAPGAATPFATLTANGNATFDAGSTYRVNINANGQSDKLAINGTATLNGGTVDVLAANGTYSPSSRYTILTASAGRTGQFSNATLSSNLAFLTPVLSYDAKDVYLGFAQTAPIASGGATPGQQATAGAVQSLGPSNPVYQAVLTQTSAGAQQALQSLSGQAHAATPAVAVNSTHFSTRAVFDRLWNIPVDGGGDAVSVLDAFGSTTTPAALRCYTPQDFGPGGNLTPANYTVWGQAVGDFGRISGDRNAATITSTLAGFALGIDTKVDAAPFNNWRVGVSGGYTSDDFHVHGGGGQGTFENAFGTLYAGARYGAVDVRLAGTYGATTTTTARTVAFPGFNEAERAVYGGDVAQGSGELGYRFALSQAVVEPVAGAGVTYVHEDRYRERGGNAALIGFAQDTTVEFTTLGFRSEATPFGQLPIVARLFLGWQHSFGDLNPASTQAFRSGSAAFSTYGIPIDRDAAVAETALEYQATSQMKLSLAYTGQIGARDRDNAVRGRMDYRF